MNVIVDSGAAYGLTLFGLSLALGFVLCILRSFVEVLQVVLRTGKVAYTAIDFTFWVLCGLAVFCLSLAANTGVVRGYILAGCCIGAALNRLCIADSLLRRLRNGVLKKNAAKNGRKGKKNNSNA